MYNLVVVLLAAIWCLILPCYAESQLTPLFEPFENEKRAAGIDCFDWEGTRFSNNTQCPDSLTCCSTAAVCLPNRMCIGNGVLIRPTCAVHPWDNQTCANICQYESGNGVLPRITMCNDGSYCCDDDPKCCTNGKGSFLNSSGHVVAAASAVAGLASSGAANSTATTTTIVTATGSASGGMPAADKAAIGVLVGVLVLVVLGAGFVIWRKRRQVRYMKSENFATQQAHSYHLSNQYPQKPDQDSIGFGPQELGDHSRSKFSELPTEPTPDLRSSK